MMKTQLYVSPENALYRRIELQHMPNGKLRMEGVDMSGIRGCRNRWIPGLAPLARNDPARWQAPSALVTRHSNLPKAGIISSHLAPRHSNLTSCAARRRPSCLWWREG